MIKKQNNIIKTNISMKSFVKQIWFNIHKICMYIIPFIWIIEPKIVLLYLVVILSWFLNKNKCILTEVEFYLFNETFLGKGKKCYVPRKHRNILYINTCLCMIYLLVSNKQVFLKP